MDLAWPQWAEVAAAFAAAVVLAVAAVALLTGRWSRQNDPDEKERLRRLDVNRHGRIVSGECVDIVDAEVVPNGASRRFIHYRYSVGAVDFAASQDVTMIADLIGDDPRGIVGSIAVKYHNRNPYNSIIVCETWSGLRRSREAARRSQEDEAASVGPVTVADR